MSEPKIPSRGGRKFRYLLTGLAFSTVALLSATVGALLAVSMSGTPLRQVQLNPMQSAIFGKEENQNILSKDMLNKFKEFQALPEDDKHKNIKNFYVPLKSNFFENLEKLEVQTAKIIQNGAIKDENKRPVVDKLVDRALNNPKIKAIE